MQAQHTGQEQNTNTSFLFLRTPMTESAAEASVSAACTSKAEKDALVLQHLPLVRFVARSLQRRMPQHVELDDLISAGTMGLMDAVNRFDAAKQVQFKSYAQIRIRGAILDSLRATDWSPRELRRQARSITEATHTLSARLGRTPTDIEIAAEMGLDYADYLTLTSDVKGLEVGSLNLERTEGADEEELDFLAAPEEEGPLARFVSAEERQRVAEAIAELPEKERLVLALYYFEEMTMKEVGLTLGVVESRVSQLRAAALTKLRKKLRRSPARPVVAA